MIAAEKLPQHQRQRRALSPCIGDAETPKQDSSLALRALAAQQFAALEQEIVPPDQQLIPAALATAFGIADAATYVEKIDPREDFPAKGYVGRSLNSSIGDRSGCYDVRGRANFAVEDTSPFTPRQPVQIGEPPLGDGKGARGDRGVKFSSGKGGAFAFPRPSAPTRKSVKHTPSDAATGNRDAQAQSSKLGTEPAVNGDKSRRSFPGEPAMGSGAFMSCAPSVRASGDFPAKSALQRGEDGAANLKLEADFRPAALPGPALGAAQQAVPVRLGGASEKDAEAKPEPENKSVGHSPRVAPPACAWSEGANPGAGIAAGSLPTGQGAPSVKPSVAAEEGGAAGGGASLADRERERAAERDASNRKGDAAGAERGLTRAGGALQEASGQSLGQPAIAAPMPVSSAGGGGGAIARPIPIMPGAVSPAVAAVMSGGTVAASGGVSAGGGCVGAPPSAENERKRKHGSVGTREEEEEEEDDDDDLADDNEDAEDDGGSDVEEEAGDGSGSEQGAGEGGDDRGSSGRQQGQGQGSRGAKRARLVWTPALHCRFMEAVNHLGLANAVPKTIMQLMNVDGLTRENVASHLQKYRIFKKREAASCKPGWMSSFVKPSVPPPVPMARIMPTMGPMYGNMCGMVVPDARMENHPRLQQHQHMPVPRRPGQDGFMPIPWEARLPHPM